MNVTRSVYMPGVPTTTSVWWQKLQDYLPDRGPFEESEGQRARAEEQLKSAMELAANSQFFQDPYVQVAMVIRYNVLSFWPMFLLMVPVVSSIVEHPTDNT